MAFDKDSIIASLKEASISDLNDLVKELSKNSMSQLQHQLLLLALLVATLLQLRIHTMLN